MNTDFDPYQPPVLDEESDTIKAAPIKPSEYPYRYSAKQACLLVHIHHHQLPDRCVCCNEAAVEYKERTLHWQSSFMYVLLIVNLLIFVVMYFMTRKKITLSIGLCHQHMASRNSRVLLFALMMVASIFILFSWSLLVQLWWLIPFLFFGGLIGLLRFSGPLRVSLVEPEWVHIKGCGVAFIKSLDPIDDDENPRTEVKATE